MRRRYAKLQLKINKTKSAVISMTGRNFLDYDFWFVKRGVKRKGGAAKSIAEDQATDPTVRARDAVADAIEREKPYLPSYKAYLEWEQTQRI